MKFVRCINIVILGLLALAFVACEADRECRQDSGIGLNVVFQGDSLQLNAEGTAFDTIRFTSVSGMTLHGAGVDSLLMNGSAASSVKLPLRPDTTFSDFVLEYNGYVDTMRVLHLNDMQFVSLACGCFVYHTIENVRCTHAFVDSVVILNSAVSATKDPHLRLYFHKE